MDMDLNVCGQCLGYGVPIRHYDDCPLNDKRKKEIDRVVKNIDEDKKCENCGSVGGEKGKLLMCSGCKCTFYCGAKCQKEDWKRHKKECCDNLDFLLEKKKMEDAEETRLNEEIIDNSCIESYKEEYKKMKTLGREKTELMKFYESWWRDQGEMHNLERARKEAIEELKAEAKEEAKKEAKKSKKEAKK